MTKPERALVRRAKEQIKAARARLQSNGHSDGCSCGLCSATRALASAVGLLYEISRPKPKAKKTKKVSKKKKISKTKKARRKKRTAR